MRRCQQTNNKLKLRKVAKCQCCDAILMPMYLSLLLSVFKLKEKSLKKNILLANERDNLQNICGQDIVVLVEGNHFLFLLFFSLSFSHSCIAESADLLLASSHLLHANNQTHNQTNKKLTKYALKHSLKTYVELTRETFTIRFTCRVSRSLFLFRSHNTCLMIFCMTSISMCAGSYR